MANRSHIPLLYFFRSDGAAGFFDVGKLKAALAKALVAFYPLAGRLGVAAEGRLEISCTAEGALFVVARSGLITVDGLVREFEPSPEMRRLFVPRAEPEEIMLAVQVTFLKCGGVVLGMALHGIAVDGASTCHFLKTWSSLARDGIDKATLQLPCHDRALLRARSPSVAVRADAFSAFLMQRTLSESLAEPVVTRILAISRDQLAALKRLCGGAATSFRAVAANVWQCACIARGLAPDARAHLVFPANIRRHLRPPLPEHYFGNAAIRPRAAGLVQDIVSGTLASVADRIKSVADQLNDELVKSAIEYLEVAGKPGSLERGSFPATELRVISWLGMPFYDANFGWGKPQFMARAELQGSGLVYLMHGRPEDNGGICVVVSFGAATMAEFEKLLYAKLHYAKL